MTPRLNPGCGRSPFVRGKRSDCLLNSHCAHLLGVDETSGNSQCITGIAKPLANAPTGSGLPAPNVKAKKIPRPAARNQAASTSSRNRENVARHVISTSAVLLHELSILEPNA